MLISTSSDLNPHSSALLFKYEVDIANAIRDIFDDSLDLVDDFELSVFPFGTDVEVPENIRSLPGVLDIWNKPVSSLAVRQTSALWFARAARRQQLVNHYCWNAGVGLFFDWNTKTKQKFVLPSRCL